MLLKTFNYPLIILIKLFLFYIVLDLWFFYLIFQRVNNFIFLCLTWILETDSSLQIFYFGLKLFYKKVLLFDFFDKFFVCGKEEIIFLWFGLVHLYLFHTHFLLKRPYSILHLSNLFIQAKILRNLVLFFGSKVINLLRLFVKFFFEFEYCFWFKLDFLVLLLQQLIVLA